MSLIRVAVLSINWFFFLNFSTKVQFFVWWKKLNLLCSMTPENFTIKLINIQEVMSNIDCVRLITNPVVNVVDPRDRRKLSGIHMTCVLESFHTFLFTKSVLCDVSAGMLRTLINQEWHVWHLNVRDIHIAASSTESGSHFYVAASSKESRSHAR